MLGLPIYITGDTHFNHDKLIEWGRPADFEAKQLASHERIPADAYLLHLGDFCIGKDEAMHEQWLGAVEHVRHRVLVRGNHDNKSVSWYLNHGWHAVVDIMELDLFGKRVVFSHVPVDPADYDWCQYNVHAHTHGNGHRDHDVGHLLDEAYHVEYAPELFNYQPMLLTQKVLPKGGQ